MVLWNVLERLYRMFYGNLHEVTSESFLEGCIEDSMLSCGKCSMECSIESSFVLERRNIQLGAWRCGAETQYADEAYLIFQCLPQLTSKSGWWGWWCQQKCWWW